MAGNSASLRTQHVRSFLLDLKVGLIKDGKVQRNGFSGSPKVTYFELGWQEG